MELTKLGVKLPELFRKYKFPILIMMIGLILMLFTFPETDTNNQSITETELREATFEETLSEILSKIKGAGKVAVMLTVQEGEEVLYQADENFSGNGDSADKRTDTVILSDTDRAESGLVRQVNPPVYRGAIIVCQGADDPAVRLAITEAVSKITGIGANCISVLRMN